MKGNVYTRQKCFICGGPLVHDERRGGCFCKAHPEAAATKDFYVKFGRDINRRRPTYEASIRFLTGLRYETDRGTFDARDYAAHEPLGFRNLVKSYLAWKRRKKLTSYYHIAQYMDAAADHWGNRNVKTIRKRDIEEYLYAIPGISEKTRFNHRTQLHDFWHSYLYAHEEVLLIHQLPKFPAIPYELGFRKFATIEDREKVMDRVRELTYHYNPKIWLALDLGCTYSKLRPFDIRRIKEGDIDVVEGVLTIERPSKSQRRRRPKVIRLRLLGYHVDEFRRMKAMYPAGPATLFFRHPPGIRGVQADDPFGKGFLYKKFKRACRDIGIDDLDMYGGTRHTTITAIGRAAGKTAARKHSGHDTDAAFDRYCQIDDESDAEMAGLVAKIRGKVVPLDQRKKKGR